jgi:hypothetical protein
MQTADELRAIAQAKLTNGVAGLRAERAQAHEKVVTGYLDKMHAALEKAPALAASGAGRVEVYEVRGDLEYPGFGKKYPDYQDLEEAWQRLIEELTPLGYGLACLSQEYDTGEYDTPTRHTTEFIVEWNNPWLSGRDKKGKG